MVEAHHAATARGVHDGKTHGIGVADGLVGKPLEPGPGRSMMSLASEDDGEQRAGLESVECRHRGTDTGAVEQEPMRLGENEVGREQPDPARRHGPKHGVGFGVVLVAGADERDPGAAIDEQASGDGASGGRSRASRQRRSP